MNALVDRTNFVGVQKDTVPLDRVRTLAVVYVALLRTGNKGLQLPVS